MKKGKMDTTFYYDFRKVQRGIWRSSDTDGFKKEVLFGYLYDLREKLSYGGACAFVPALSKASNGLITLFGEGDLADEAREEDIGHILSKDRMYVPTMVSCPDKKYELVEVVLKSERGEGACLRRGIEGWISNIRLIKHGKEE